MRQPTRFAAIVFGAIAMVAAAASAALAETYPSRPVHLYVSYPPGGASDIIARLLAQPLSEKLGQPVVVENKPGSGGNLAGDLVAHAAADGYTILLGPSNLFTINPHLYKKMSFDPMKDLVPIATVVANQLLLVVNNKVPANTFQEFIALAKKSNPPLFYASIGNGSLHHLAMEMLKQDAGVNITHVPYRGGGPAGIAVLAGDVSAMFGGGSVFNMVETKQVRGLAVTSRKRVAALPNLPSISEFYPDYEADIWQGVFAPAATPQPIVDRLRKSLDEVIAMPDFAAKLAKTGSGEPYPTSLKEFAARIHRDSDRFGKIVKNADLKLR